MNLSSATVGQIMIPVEDFGRGESFYRDVLGIPFLFATPPQMAFFLCGSVRLLVGVMPPGQSAQRGSAIYFKVFDIQSTFAELQAKGAEFVATPHLVNRSPKAELWLAEFKGPDGNRLALMAEISLGG